MVILEAPKVILGFPEESHLAAKSFKTVLEDMPCPLECQGGPEMAPRGPKVPELT